MTAKDVIRRIGAVADDELKELAMLGLLSVKQKELFQRVKKGAERGRLNLAVLLNGLQQVIEEGFNIFLPQGKQLLGFLYYDQWLRVNYPEHSIPKDDIGSLCFNIELDDSDGLIFYCHQGDIALSAKLAWEYICSYRATIQGIGIKFEDMVLSNRELHRPKGFYILKIPLEDQKAIGKKFQGKSADEVCRKLGKDWGMGPEGFQIVGITHKHYPELMDGDTFPFINLPAITTRFDQDKCLQLDVIEGKLRLTNTSFTFPDIHYGCGFLQQP